MGDIIFQVHTQRTWFANVDYVCKDGPEITMDPSQCPLEEDKKYTIKTNITWMSTWSREKGVQRVD